MNAVRQLRRHQHEHAEEQIHTLCCSSECPCWWRRNCRNVFMCYLFRVFFLLVCTLLQRLCYIYAPQTSLQVPIFCKHVTYAFSRTQLFLLFSTLFEIEEGETIFLSQSADNGCEKWRMLWYIFIKRRPSYPNKHKGYNANIDDRIISMNEANDQDRGLKSWPRLTS